MCIVLLTTAHPSYALIVLDNRDEFILRPTSRPHWWHPPHPPGEAPTQQVLSSRDLQRRERGTWLGVTRAGHFAVLTNYREASPRDASRPRSRGAMVTAWLAASPAEPAPDFVARMLAGGVSGVGGFSLICGKLRRAGGQARALEPLAILSNRARCAADIPAVGGRRGEVVGLSNTSYDDPVPWGKVEDGKRLLRAAVEAAAARGATEPELVEELFGILDRDTLPSHPGMSFEDYIGELKHSIFIPLIGDEEQRSAMDSAAVDANDDEAAAATAELKAEERPDEAGTGFATGLYGTQRQTVVLVDWDGNVTFVERALWDAKGKPIERGKGDMSFKFKIDGWEGHES